MFVNAPRRSTLGTTTQSRSTPSAFVSIGSATTGYASPSAAQDAVEAVASYSSTVTGVTTKSILQSGRIGDKLVDTMYATSYEENSPGFDFASSAWHAGTSLPNQWVGNRRSMTVATWDGIPGITEIQWSKTATTPYASLNQLIVSNLQNRARAEARLKALDTNLDLAETFTGMPQTVRLVAERATQVIRAFVALRGRHYQRAADILGLRRKWGEHHNQANVWLEMQYGWLPLLSDIFDGTEEIYKLVSHRNVNPVKVVTRRLGSNLFIYGTNPSNANWGSLRAEKSARATVEVKLRFAIADPFVAYMSQLRVNNPAYIAWTALPYSFVVDWMLPVGDMLSALNSHIGLKFHGGYVTTKAIGSVTLTGTQALRTGVTTINYRGSSTARTRGLYMQRTSLSTWPYVLPYVTFPLGSDKRIANAIALIAASRKFH